MLCKTLVMNIIRHAVGRAGESFCICSSMCTLDVEAFTFFFYWCVVYPKYWYVGDGRQDFSLALVLDNSSVTSVSSMQYLTEHIPWIVNAIEMYSSFNYLHTSLVKEWPKVLKKAQIGPPQY